MATVRFSAEGQNDLNEIRNHLLRKTDFEFTRKQMNRFRVELQRLADTPMLDREDSGFNGPDDRWYWLLDSRFKVFYERRASGIKVVMIRHAKMEPLDPSTI